MPACPICEKTTSVRPSSPRPGDWRRRLFGKEAYRCQQCSHRFFSEPDILPQQPEPEIEQSSEELTPEELAALNAAKIEPKVFDFRDFGGLPLDLDGEPLHDVPAITFDYKTLGAKAQPLTPEDLENVVDPQQAAVFDYMSLVAPTIHVDFEEEEVDEEDELIFTPRVGLGKKLRSTSSGRRVWRESIRIRWNGRRIARKGYSGFVNFLELLWYYRPTEWPWRRIFGSLPFRIFVAGFLTELAGVFFGIPTHGVLTTDQVSIGATGIDTVFSFVFAVMILRRRHVFGDRVKGESFQLAIGLFLMEWFWDWILGVCGVPIRWNFRADWSYIHLYWILITLQGPVTFLAIAFANFAYRRSSFYRLLSIDPELRFE